MEASNFYRRLIAVRRRDLTAAEGYFAATVTAAPFTSEYHYSWAETLRLARVCRFIRIARIEATQGEAVSAELAK
ncbi:MAG: hypothetical protein ABIR29_04760 [Chthoniobacterales bacterium]